MRKYEVSHFIEFKKRKINITINSSGFTVWDVDANQWIIDASSLEDDGTFVINKNIADKEIPSEHLMFPIKIGKSEAIDAAMLAEKKESEE